MIKICIDMEGAAFSENSAAEVIRILKRIISGGGIEDVIYTFNANQKRGLLDLNGETCGFIQLKTGYCENEE